LFLTNFFIVFFRIIKLLIDLGKFQVGSLAGAAHFLKDNEGVQRLAHLG